MALRVCTIRVAPFVRQRFTTSTTRYDDGVSVCARGAVSRSRRWLSTTEGTSMDKDNDEAKEMPPYEQQREIPSLIYEGPFGPTSLLLKRVSITTAAVSLVGIPLLIAIQTNDIPAMGQLAVGGTALVAASGSTVALSYCFSPYVHRLEWVVPGEGGEEGETEKHPLLRATTRNILARKVETVFDPLTDVTPPSGARPFCNFVAKGLPMYVHPEMLFDETLRVQLLGETEENEEVKTKEKQDDDELI